MLKKKRRICLYLHFDQNVGRVFAHFPYMHPLRRNQVLCCLRYEEWTTASSEEGDREKMLPMQQIASRLCPVQVRAHVHLLRLRPRAALEQRELPDMQSSNSGRDPHAFQLVDTHRFVLEMEDPDPDPDPDPDLDLYIM